jgi:hypothetical protein
MSDDNNDLLSAAYPERKKNVVDFDPIKQQFDDFQAQIAATNDVTDLIKNVRDRVWCSELPMSMRERLVKEIAKKTKTKYSTLVNEAERALGSLAPGDDDQNWLQKLNAKHAIVTTGNSVKVMIEGRDPSFDGVRAINYLSPQDFILLYESERVYLAGRDCSIAEAWLRSPRRRQYDGVVFSPGKDEAGFFNLFNGFPVAPKAGDCSKFKEFMFNVICAGNPLAFDYFYRWTAHLFQRPQQLPETAPVLRGDEGLGKGTWVTAIARLVGKQHYRELTSMDQVVGRFNGHLQDALLVFANEALWGGDKSAEGALKAMVTDKNCSIERKGRDIIQASNYRRLILASNDRWPMPRGINDRRFFVLDVADKRHEDFAYWDAIQEELDSGGLAALMHDFMSVDLSGWHPRKMPKRLSQLGADIKERSAGSVVKWWLEALQEGRFSTPLGDGPEDEAWPVLSVPRQALQRDYLAWCHRQQERRPATANALGTELAKFGVRSGRPHKGPRFYWLPSLDEARELCAQAMSLPPDYWGL